MIAESLEAAYPKAGNVSPLVSRGFTYADLLIEAWRLKKVCETGLPLGLSLYTFLRSQRVTALSGFAILATPLFKCLHLGLHMGECGRIAVERSTPLDAYWYLMGLKESGMTHLKRVYAKNFPDVNDPQKALEKGWNLAYVLKMSKDTLSYEILHGYPLSRMGAEYLLENGMERIPELQGLILSKALDDLVARKHGYEVAIRLTEMARANVHEFYIKALGLNPGTTADIIGVAILMALSEKLKEGELK